MASPSLDYAFLRYFGVDAAVEERFHAFYLPLLADYRRVIDLGSGMGGFVRLLSAAGHEAWGVDADEACVAAARALGCEIVQADVLDYLSGLEPGSVDAIFSAHLVEHLPYQTVLDVIRLSHRVLRPGGRLLLVTPNPRALITHLEFYHQHFGHVSLYQPELLAFFMRYSGFAHTDTGENPDTAPDKIAPGHPLAQLAQPPAPAPAWEEILPRPSSLLRQLLWFPKRRLAAWLVRPYTDALGAGVRENRERLTAWSTALNRPFECWALGDKAG